MKKKTAVIIFAAVAAATFINCNILFSEYSFAAGGSNSVISEEQKADTMKHYALKVDDPNLPKEFAGERSYLVYLPEKFKSDGKKLPAIFVLHGGGGDAKKTRGFKLNELSLHDTDGIVIVYPEGSGKGWNDGRESVNILAQKNGVDDVGFLNALVDRIVKDFNVDSKRIYFIGISNGGMMTQRFVNEHSEKVAAAGIVIANLPKNLVTGVKDGKGGYKVQPFGPKKPTPMFFIIGTEDPLMPFSGGKVLRKSKDYDRGEVIGSVETVKMWAKANGCDPKPAVTELPDTDKKDGVTVKKEVFSGKKGCPEVVLLVMHGGGHAWPGLKYGPVIRMVLDTGKVCYDFDAPKTIWNFFQKYKRD